MNLILIKYAIFDSVSRKLFFFCKFSKNYMADKLFYPVKQKCNFILV